MYYCDSFKAHLSSETSQEDLFPNLHNKLALKIKIECAINKDHKLIVYNELGAFLSLSLWQHPSSWAVGQWGEVMTNSDKTALWRQSYPP